MDSRVRNSGKTSRLKRKHYAEKSEKFIGNKETGQGFADKRKRKMKYEYMKLMQKDKDVVKEHRDLVKQIYTAHSPGDAGGSNPIKRKKTLNSKSKLESAKLYAQKRKQDKKKERQELQEKEVARNAAHTQYRQKKLEKHKKLSKKTVRGQPVMKNQIEALLEKIQKQS